MVAGLTACVRAIFRAGRLAGYRDVDAFAATTEEYRLARLLVDGWPARLPIPAEGPVDVRLAIARALVEGGADRDADAARVAVDAWIREVAREFGREATR